MHISKAPICHTVATCSYAMDDVYTDHCCWVHSAMPMYYIVHLYETPPVSLQATHLLEGLRIDNSAGTQQMPTLPNRINCCPCLDSAFTLALIATHYLDKRSINPTRLAAVVNSTAHHIQLPALTFKSHMPLSRSVKTTVCTGFIQHACHTLPANTIPKP